MRFVGHARRWLVAGAAAIVVLGGGATAVAATSGGASIGGNAHPHRVTPPAIGAPAAGAAASTGKQADVKSGASPATSAPAASAPAEFTSIANPITLDPPVRVPSTKPVAVTIDDNASFGNTQPPSTTVTLPKGNWAKVILDITGSQSGRQYDRLMNVFAGQTQIFLGVTPEPSAAGITWHISKDVTDYLPALEGSQTFTTTIDNYVGGIYTGIPVINAKLLFYPAGDGYSPAHTASLADPSLGGDSLDQAGPASPATSEGVPNDIVPLVPSGDSTDFNTINTGQTLTASVTLPDNITTATLDLYAVGQIDDEFWMGESPAFREIEVSIDGKPAGVVWPYPYVYTGGINPLIWEPLTGLHTEDIPAYQLDLTPFAGLLSGSGPHTISLSVHNDNDYWIAGGDLMLTDGGAPVTGSVSTDSLSFPTSSAVTTQDALGDSDQPVTSESAAASYTISGTVAQGGRTSTDTLKQDLQFYNDQSYIDPACTSSCYQYGHQETASSASETITGPGVHTARDDKSSYSIDIPNGYTQNSGGSDFFLPASVTQQLTDMASQGTYQTSLSETINGYGALEEDNDEHTVSDGETTGTITVDDGGDTYLRTVLTRGGQIVQDLSS